MKKFMFVNRKAPYGTIYALESLEVVLIAATFDQDCSLVFADDGVYQLAKGQNTKAIALKNFSPTYRALEDYDIEKLYVERESLAARGLTEDDLMVPVAVLSSAELAELMAAQEYLWDYYTRVALNRGIQASRNSGKAHIKYAEAYMRVFPTVADEFDKV